VRATAARTPPKSKWTSYGKEDRSMRIRFAHPAKSWLASLALALFALALAACADRGPTEPGLNDDPALAADRMRKIADSVALMQGEAAALPYRDAADQIGVAQRISRITISIDGTAQEFAAVAGESVINIGCALPPGVVSPIDCKPRAFFTRTLIAWQLGDPRRLVLLSTSAESGDIGLLVASTLTSSTSIPGFLQYVEGKDRFFFGTSGHYASTIKLGDPCGVRAVDAANSSDLARTAPKIECKQAEFTWELEATVGVPPVATMRTNAATGTHKLALAKSTVLGAQLTMTISPPPIFPPPPLPERKLSSSLKVTVEADVTLAYTVKNESTTPVELHFPTGQRYDFAVTDKTGRVLWRWGEGKAFPMEVGVKVLAGGESVTFTEHWTPTAHGELIAMGFLTSKEEKMLARSPFTVP
jgi:hypothetical protein